MVEHKLSEPDAFKWIQRAAMDNRTTMKAVAEVVLGGPPQGGVDGAVAGPVGADAAVKAARA